jgi:methylenetetrahydrofolate dehydrogenase (NADP+)/methenyltetrahydrofolate cyclohydrolase
MANRLYGKALAAKMQAELAEKTAVLKAKGVTPGLVVVLVGEDPASQVYVRNKERSANTVGFNSEIIRLPETTTEVELLSLIAELNADPQWHGILVQLPLPKHIDEEKVLLAISPEKDVDGFHPFNMGQLWAGNGHLKPSTPAGIMALLDEYNVEIEGKRAVIIGRSNIVGKPMAALLLERNATVTIAHSRTQDLPALAKEADILVVAIGRGHFVTKDFVKEGAVVVDVGMNRDENGKLIGDVAFDEVSEIASAITPVPGGVGPMTITMLMEQACNIANQ